MTSQNTFLSLVLLLLGTTAGSLFGNRNIQFREVDFTTSVIELHNFGTTAQALGNWRFCSHDENQTRQYSASGGLNGITIPAGGSFFIHYLNNAPAASNAINISTIGGGFARVLDRGPYAIGLYNGGSFGQGANIIDHVQWSVGGVDNTTADERSDEAQSGGTWTDQSVWVSTTAESEKIVLNDTTGGVLHGPTSYTAIEPLSFPTILSIEAISVDSGGVVSLTWQDLSEFGTVNYTVEISSDLTSEGWSPVFETPLQTTTTTINDLPEGPQFFRVIAEIAS